MSRTCLIATLSITVTHAVSKVKLNRPGANAIKIHAAICEGESVSFVSESAVGGVATEMNEHHMKIWKLNEKPVEATPCTNFKTVFADNGVTEVALFSLDVEGAENQVLAGYDSYGKRAFLSFLIPITRFCTV